MTKYLLLLMVLVVPVWAWDDGETQPPSPTINVCPDPCPSIPACPMCPRCPDAVCVYPSPPRILSQTHCHHDKRWHGALVCRAQIMP